MVLRFKKCCGGFFMVFRGKNDKINFLGILGIYVNFWIIKISWRWDY